MLNSSTWQIAHQRAIGDRDSNTLLATVALGGDYAPCPHRRASDRSGRHHPSDPRCTTPTATRCTTSGRCRTTPPPRTNSDLLFKGAVQDHAKSVYTGLIKIRHQAKGSVAFQTNRNLTLSEGAWAESVPNLDIDTNDVKCSHASTIGPIDEEQRFYLESRGHPARDRGAARRARASIDEVLDQMPGRAFAADARAEVGAKLARRSRRRRGRERARQDGTVVWPGSTTSRRTPRRRLRRGGKPVR
jgi:Fe-S cluster assembly protein SufD